MMRGMLMLVLVAFFSVTAVGSELRVGTWNLARLGEDDTKDIRAMASVIAGMDFIAAQEVISGQSLAALHRSVEAQSGEPWGVLQSHPIGRGSYKESYAFLYRTSKVEYVDGAVVYLDRGDRFAREPMSARFRVVGNGVEFVASSVHILYGRSEADRLPEIAALSDYWAWLGETYPGTDNLMVMGDFNLPPSHAAWSGVRGYASPIVERGASTLSPINNRYVSLFDNIWISSKSSITVTKAGVYQYPKQLNWSHEKARQLVSDHAPVVAVMTMENGPDQSVIKEQGVQVAAPQHQLAMANDSTSKAVFGVRGNQKSMIYHRPDCPSYADVNPRNRIDFASAAEAGKAGYRLAANCP